MLYLSLNLVNNPESDITCRSSDFISFKLKRVNLQMFSNIPVLFADALSADSPNPIATSPASASKQRLDACGEFRTVDAEGTKGKGLGTDDEAEGDQESRDDRGGAKGGSNEFFSVDGNRNRVPSPSPSSASTSTLTPSQHYGRAPPSPTPSPPPLNRTQTASSNSPTPPPTITLTESSATLEILFQFMHNQPQPIATIAIISFSSLVALVSAVEKYQVHAAKEACRNRLRYVGSISPRLSPALPGIATSRSSIDSIAQTILRISIGSSYYINHSKFCISRQSTDIPR